MLVMVCGSVNVVESESEKVKREFSKNGCHVLCIQDALLSSSYMPLFHSFVFLSSKDFLACTILSSFLPQDSHGLLKLGS